MVQLVVPDPDRTWTDPLEDEAEFRREIIDYLRVVRDQYDLSAKVLNPIIQLHEPRLYLRDCNVVLGLIEKQARIVLYDEIQQ
jgi:hypothetical protein